MIIYLPCKIGEQFIEQKYKGCTDGIKEYIDGSEQILKGFHAFDSQTGALSIPTILTDTSFLSFDPSGVFQQGFIPRYRVSVDVKTECKLSDRGFPSNKTGRLYGLSKEGEYLLADFVTNDRYEHLMYVIKDNIQYTRLDKEISETIIEYDNNAQKKRLRDRESREGQKGNMPENVTNRKLQNGTGRKIGR